MKNNLIARNQPKEMRDDLIKLKNSFGSYRNMAKELGYSPTYLNFMAIGKQPICEKLAELIGWKLTMNWYKNEF